MLQDLRFAVRQLVRSRGFAVTAFVTLALGIGMTPAIFGVVDGVLFRSIPFPDAARLVMVWETDRDTGTSHEPGAWPDFIDFQRRATRIDRLAGIIAGETTLTPDRGDPVRLAGLVVTRELGIRLALGASPRSVARLVVGQGARLTVVGLAVGLVLAVLFSRALSGLLFGVTATDPWTFAIVVAVLGAVGLIATWLPVRRATRVDPLVLFHPHG